MNVKSAWPKSPFFVGNFTTADRLTAVIWKGNSLPIKNPSFDSKPQNIWCATSVEGEVILIQCREFGLKYPNY